MSVIEFIGFIISLVTMFFLFFKKLYDDRQRRLNPEEYAKKTKERERQLKEFWKSMDVNMDQNDDRDEEDEEDKPQPPPHPIVPPPIKKPMASLPHSRPLATENRSLSDTFHTDNAYKKQKGRPRAFYLARRHQSLRDAIILKEIIDKPKGLRF